MTETPPESFLSTGEQLRQARESRKISLEQVVTMTRIRLRYLMAFETDDWSVFPSNSQARGFLKAYAAYLGLDADQLMISTGEQPVPTSATPVSGRQTPSSTESPSGEAESIFVQIGIKLRSQRELVGLSLPDIERHTHLRLHYLQSLESGNLEGLPSPVQGKGMLKNYAAFLGLDPEPLLLRYAEGLQARLAAKRKDHPAERRPVVKKPIRRRLLTPDLMLAGLMVVLLLGFVGWGALRIVELRTQQTPVAKAPSIAEVLGVTATPSPLSSTAPSEANTPTPPASALEGALPSPTIPPTSSNAAIQVYLVAKQRAWVQVKVDGKLVFEGRVIPGNAYPYSGNERVELITGNGAALQVFYNQIDLGTLGGFGDVVERIFTIGGIQTPTATITSTPGPATPTPSLTPVSPTPKP